MKIRKRLVSLFSSPLSTYPVWWAFDIKWENDDFFSFEQYFWSSAPLPKYVFINKTRVQNQWLKDLTAYACTCYSAVHASNDLVFKERWYEYSPEDLNWISLWWDALVNWAQKNSWWTLNWPLELLRQRWIITWYTVVNTLEWVKQALAGGNPICTWACNIMRNYTYSNWIAKWDNQNNIWCHAFTIHWYDDEKQMLICKNSYWSEVAKKWYFWVEYSNFNMLWTNYVLHNKDNATTLKKIRYDLNLKLAKDKWIWNWARARDTITKSERDIVCNRLSVLSDYRKILRWDAVNYLMEERKRIDKLIDSANK